MSSSKEDEFGTYYFGSLYVSIKYGLFTVPSPPDGVVPGFSEIEGRTPRARPTLPTLRLPTESTRETKVSPPPKSPGEDSQ